MLVSSFVKYWVPVIAWTLLIFGASGDSMSAEHTSRFLTPFLLWLNSDISFETVTLIHLFIRKTGHVAEYAILALLVRRALGRGTNFQATAASLSRIAWIACVVAAIADEFRQSFVQSRGPSPWDVMIDGAGAIFGLWIYSWFARRKSGKKNIGAL